MEQEKISLSEHFSWLASVLWHRLDDTTGRSRIIMMLVGFSINFFWRICHLESSLLNVVVPWFSGSSCGVFVCLVKPKKLIEWWSVLHSATVSWILAYSLPLVSLVLASLSYVHASICICFSANIHHYHSNNSAAMFVLVIVPVNHPISQFIF